MSQPPCTFLYEEKLLFKLIMSLRGSHFSQLLYGLQGALKYSPFITPCQARLIQIQNLKGSTLILYYNKKVQPDTHRW